MAITFVNTTTIDNGVAGGTSLNYVPPASTLAIDQLVACIRLDIDGNSPCKSSAKPSQ